MASVSCQLDRIQSPWGDGSLGLPLGGALLVILTEVGRAACGGQQHSLHGFMDCVNSEKETSSNVNSLSFS